MLDPVTEVKGTLRASLVPPASAPPPTFHIPRPPANTDSLPPAAPAMM